MSHIANQLFGRLQGDPQRVARSFSDDILRANAALHNSSATDEELFRCLLIWCGNQQPCLFGRSAANKGRLHFSILRDAAVRTWSDEEIAAKIDEDRKLWKRRALKDASRAAHSFIIVVASSDVAMAAPDRSLREFSEKILELAGWANTPRSARRVNTISSDFLYLQHPESQKYYGFQFNLDFFACAGDRRWWHDHRFPGGIAFTGNSTGHLRAFREWYPGEGDGKSDVKTMLSLAMRTIKSAAPMTAILAGNDPPREVVDPMAEGRATWLLDLDRDGRPLARDVAPPWDAAPPGLQGKDWTRYEGVLHTDHAIREEFFDPRDVPATRPAPYRMEFSYLFNQGQSDFIEFTGGREFTEQEIYEELGSPDTWTHRGAPEVERTEDEARAVADQLDALQNLPCPDWIEPLID